MWFKGWARFRTGWGRLGKLMRKFRGEFGKRFKRWRRLLRCSRMEKVRREKGQNKKIWKKNTSRIGRMVKGSWKSNRNKRIVRVPLPHNLMRRKVVLIHNKMILQPKWWRIIHGRTISLNPPILPSTQPRPRTFLILHIHNTLFPGQFPHHHPIRLPIHHLLINLLIPSPTPQEPNSSKEPSLTLLFTPLRSKT